MVIKGSNKQGIFNRILAGFLVFSFIGSSLILPKAEAEGWNLMRMPRPGVMVGLSPAYTPTIIRGMSIDVKNPFAFNFLMDQGDQKLDLNQQKEAYKTLVKDFLTAMTIDEDKQWVNLSPYEGHRIIEDNFGKTITGRDLLAEDYMLKQITASLIYPEDAIGKQFWQKVYTQAAQKYGTTQIPVNTFNKVWILPETASVFEKNNTVYIVDAKLKVMLEEDYLSTQRHQEGQAVVSGAGAIAKRAMLDIVIPALTKEVNEGKNFARLRQI